MDARSLMKAATSGVRQRRPAVQQSSDEDAKKFSVLDLRTNVRTTYTVDPGLTGLGGYPVPKQVQVTGGHAAVVEEVPVYDPLDSHQRRLFDRLSLSFQRQIGQGRFPGKEVPHAEAVLGEETWTHQVGSTQSVPVAVKVLRKGAPITPKNLHRPDEADVLQVLRGNGDVDKPKGGVLEVVLWYPFALKMGLLKEDHGQVFALTDRLFIGLPEVVYAVGPRNFQRQWGEPGGWLTRDDFLTRKDVDGWRGALAPIIAPYNSAGEFLSRVVTVLAMGVTSVIKNRVAWDTATGLPMGADGHVVYDQILWPAHDRAFNRAHPEDPSELIGVDPDSTGDVLEMLFAARVAQGDDFENPDDDGLAAARQKFENAALGLTDGIARKRFLELRRNRKFPLEQAERDIKVGEYGAQEMARVICFIVRDSAGNRIAPTIDSAVTTLAEYKALTPAEESRRQMVRGAALLNPERPWEMADRDLWWVTAFLTSLYDALKKYVEAFNREPKDLQRLAGDTGLFAEALPSTVLDQFRSMIFRLATVGVNLDARAREVERTALVAGGMHGQDASESANPFVQWLLKLQSRTPASYLLSDEEFDRLILGSPHGVKIVRIWALTMAKVYIPERVPDDVRKFMNDFEPGQALVNRVLTELRRKEYKGRYDELCLLFESWIVDLTKLWWEEAVWGWVRKLEIGSVTSVASVKTTMATFDPFDGSIALVDTGSAQKQYRFRERGKRATRAPHVLLGASLVFLFVFLCFNPVSRLIVAAPGPLGVKAILPEVDTFWAAVITALLVSLAWGVIQHFLGLAGVARKIRDFWLRFFITQFEVWFFTVGWWAIALLLSAFAVPIYLSYRANEIRILRGPGQICEFSGPCQEAVSKASGEWLMFFLVILVPALFLSWLNKTVLDSTAGSVFSSRDYTGSVSRFSLDKHGRPLFGDAVRWRHFWMIVVTQGATLLILFGLVALLLTAISLPGNVLANAGR